MRRTEAENSRGSFREREHYKVTLALKAINDGFYDLAAMHLAEAAAFQAVAKEYDFIIDCMDLEDDNGR